MRRCPSPGARDSQVDYTPAIGRFGVPGAGRRRAASERHSESLQGQRIGVVAGSLGEGVAKPGPFQPQATSHPASRLGAACGRPAGGDSMAVIGDTNLLSRHCPAAANAKGLVLTPSLSLRALRDRLLVPRRTTPASVTSRPTWAIARLRRIILTDEPEAIASVDPWVGPRGCWCPLSASGTISSRCLPTRSRSTPRIRPQPANHQRPSPRRCLPGPPDAFLLRSRLFGVSC